METLQIATYAWAIFNMVRAVIYACGNNMNMANNCMLWAILMVVLAK